MAIGNGPGDALTAAPGVRSHRSRPVGDSSSGNWPGGRGEAPDTATHCTGIQGAWPSPSPAPVSGRTAAGHAPRTGVGPGPEEGRRAGHRLGRVDGVDDLRITRDGHPGRWRRVRAPGLVRRSRARPAGGPPPGRLGAKSPDGRARLLLHEARARTRRHRPGCPSRVMRRSSTPSTRRAMPGPTTLFRPWSDPGPGRAAGRGPAGDGGRAGTGPRAPHAGAMRGGIGRSHLPPGQFPDDEAPDRPRSVRSHARRGRKSDSQDRFRKPLASKTTAF